MPEQVFNCPVCGVAMPRKEGKDFDTYRCQKGSKGKVDCTMFVRRGVEGAAYVTVQTRENAETTIRGAEPGATLKRAEALRERLRKAAAN